jgi:aspartyl-tRNA(Asn)/glutamyl-tRNA(Gln) amidotransferase subunit A
VGDPTELTLAAAAAAVAAGELSPVELTTAYLERIDRLNPALTAYVEVTAERALADAATLADEAAAGQLRGPMHGVPIALKDLVDTAGIPTRAGTLGYQDRVPDTDATIARRLREAGTVLLGKTATHELAYGVTTSNVKAYGSTCNPWDLERIPGGSSGGSAAAVVAGLASAATGTDTGGSIRIPAALCGCVGFKPSYGIVSRAGIAPLSWLLDHAGPITQTVTDAALVLDAISGYDPADEATLPGAGGVGDVSGRLRGDVAGWRVGVPRSTAWSALEPGVAAAAEAALTRLEALGMHLVEVELPSAEEITGPVFAFVSAECRTAHATIWPDRRDDFGPDLQQLLALPALDGDATVAVLRAVAHYAQALRRVLTEVDLLASPTVPVVAPPLGADSVRLGGADVSVISALIANTFPYNLARLPAVSVPCGDASGLPVGLQLAGAPLADARVLQAAYAYEQTGPWQQKRPRIQASAHAPRSAALPN